MKIKTLFEAIIGVNLKLCYLSLPPLDVTGNTYLAHTYKNINKKEYLQNKKDYLVVFL